MELWVLEELWKEEEEEEEERVGQSSETCSQWRQRPLSSPSGFSPAVGGGRGGEANSRAELTVFSEARVVGEKV